MNGNEIWSDQPSPGDVTGAVNDKLAVTGEDAITMLAPNARYLVSRSGGKEVVYGVQVIPKEKQAEDPV